MKKVLFPLCMIFFLHSSLLMAQNSETDVQKKVGLGFKIGAGSVVADDLSKTNQSVGPLTSLEIHYNLQETVEAITEFSYGYNDVDFSLGNANVTRIYQRAFTIGFRFYLRKIKVGPLLPTFTFGAGFYEWFYTNSDAAINLSGDDVQTYKGEDMSFHSLGLNTGLGFRYKLSENFSIDTIFRFHFIQSKDNEERFGPDDDHDQNLDVGIGFVYLFPLGN